MLKTSESVKKETDRAVQGLCALLKKIPILQVEGVEVGGASSDGAADWIVQLRVGGQPYRLVCGYRSSGQPRHARSALLALRDGVARQAVGATPIFVAPYLSAATQQMCETQGVGYLDLVGNARIAFGGVFIERVVADKPVAERRELKSLFKPKSAQVLRTLLQAPSRAWRVAQLAQASGVSLGHVSHVRTGLVDREWARVSSDGLTLCAPDALLDAWREGYTAPQGEQLSFYTPLHGRAFEDAARSALCTQDGGVGRAVFASFSAAQWLAPYARTGTNHFLANDEGVRQLQAALKLTPAPKGGNVLVIVPKDEGLLADTVEPAPGAICTSPVQTYLDLWIAGERGAEAAQHLRQECLTWPA